MRAEVSRREFLAGGVALAAARPHGLSWPKPPSQPLTHAGAPLTLPIGTKTYPFLPPAERVGFALVGLGSLTLGELLPAFGACHLARPTALVSGDLKKAHAIAKQYGIPEASCYTYETYARLADNADVQVVYNVLPNSMHKEFTLRAFKAGKHVLCEKPLGVDAADAGEIVAGAKASGRKLMVAYRMQFEPNNRYLRELIRQRTFGAVKLFNTNNSQMQPAESPKPWRLKKALAGGGALPDIGIYCLNAVRFLTGEEPFEVRALEFSTPKDPRFTEVEEAIAWMMRFPSGLVSTCTASYGTYKNQEYHFVAERGRFGMTPSYAYRGLRTNVAYTEEGVEHVDHPTQPDVNQFAAEMDHMADCVLNDKLPHTPGEEGLQDHKIMDAIYQSARTGRPVDLERITTLDPFRHPTL